MVLEPFAIYQKHVSMLFNVKALQHCIGWLSSVVGWFEFEAGEDGKLAVAVEAAQSPRYHQRPHSFLWLFSQKPVGGS